LGKKIQKQRFRIASINLISKISTGKYP
jgi:hypothetical protein